MEPKLSGDFWSFSSQKSGKKSKPKIWRIFNSRFLPSTSADSPSCRGRLLPPFVRANLGCIEHSKLPPLGGITASADDRRKSVTAQSFNAYRKLWMPRISLRGCRRSESEPNISVLSKIQNDSQTTLSGDFWSFSSQKSGKKSKPKIWLK